MWNTAYSIPHHSTTQHTIPSPLHLKHETKKTTTYHTPNLTLRSSPTTYPPPSAIAFSNPPI